MSDTDARVPDLHTLLERVEAASPVDAIDIAAEELATTLGAREVSLLMADFSGQVLVRLGRTPAATGGRTHRTEHAESVPLGGTVYEDVLRTQQVAVRDVGEDTRVTAPVTVRGDVIGAMDLLLSIRPTTSQQAEIAAVGHLLGHIVIVNRRYTDLFEWGQRTTPVSLSAEIQRRLLPSAYTCEAGQFTLAGWLEPASTVGGDTFDYALDRGTLHLSITDAAGHDVEAAMLATVLVGALRNARRAGTDLRAQVISANDGLATYSAAGRFVTGQVVRIDLDRKIATIVNAGHPAPLRLREGRVEEIDLAIDLPFGLEPGRSFQLQPLALEPGDRIVFVTDGMLERHAPIWISTPLSARPPTCTRARSCTRSARPFSGSSAATCATMPPCSAWTGTAGRRVTRPTTGPASSMPPHELSGGHIAPHPNTSRNAPCGMREVGRCHRL